MTVAAILACEMIEDETLLALERALPESERPPLIWVDGALHERPEKLNAALQELIDQLDAGARAGEKATVRGVVPGQLSASGRVELVQVEPSGDIVLGFGYCGGGLKQLVSRERRLVFPRSDDCISLFLDGGCDRGRASRDCHSYYLTKGWFCHKNAISEGFDDWVVRYGADRATQIRQMMFANYERISLIDTGAYDVDEWLAHSEARADELELAHAVVLGSVELLERLFAGDWQTDIVVLEPGEPIGIGHILGIGESHD